MTAKEQLLRELDRAPDTLVQEVLDFLLFIKARRTASESTSDRPESETTPDAQPAQQSDRPIWEIFDDFTKDLPEEVLAQLPTDGAEQHDHYIYGTPKRSQAPSNQAEILQRIEDRRTFSPEQHPLPDSLTLLQEDRDR